MGKRNSPSCNMTTLKQATRATALFDCESWLAVREVLDIEVGTPDNVLKKILSCRAVASTKVDENQVDPRTTNTRWKGWIL